MFLHRVLLVKMRMLVGANGNAGTRRRTRSSNHIGSNDTVLFDDEGMV